MKHISYIILFLTFTTQVYRAQEEKRLALVIGNANYEKGALKNPVNDALLMAKTLEELNFDVILDTNITKITQFKEVVREFGKKRDNYSVGLIYYAGHGIQFENTNYLLATKEEYNSFDDILDKAMSVQRIMRYLTNRSEEVNILILDACRDNPFEVNWENLTRSSSENSKGLAQIFAPAGSLIAFSTTAGKTAPDGEGKNSIYCQSLAKNMLVKGISLDQVFRNVRSEILKLSNSKQITEESTQLTGNTFYLVENNFKDELATIDSLYSREKYTESLELISELITRKEEIYHFARPDEYYRKSQVYWKLATESKKTDIIKQNYNKAIENITTSINLDSSNYLYRLFRGYLHTKTEDFNKAKIDINNAIKLNPNNPESHHELGGLLFLLNENYNAKETFNKCLLLDSTKIKYYYHRESIFEPHEPYFFRSNIYEEFNKYDNAFEFYDSQIKSVKKNADLYYERAGLYFITKEFNKSVSDLSTSEKYNPENSDIYHFRSLIYAHIGEYDKALKDARKIISISPSDPSGYYLLGNIYEKKEEHMTAIMKYSEAISRLEFYKNLYHIPTLDDNNFTLCDLYNKRAYLFQTIGHMNLMCEDLEKAKLQNNCTVKVVKQCK